MSASDTTEQRNPAQDETSGAVPRLWRVRLYRRDEGAVILLGSRTLTLPGPDARTAEKIALMGREPGSWRAVSIPFSSAG